MGMSVVLSGQQIKADTDTLLIRGFEPGNLKQLTDGDFFIPLNVMSIHNTEISDVCNSFGKRY